MHWLGRLAILLALALAAPASAGAGEAKAPLAALPFGGPFTLVDHHGKTRTDRDFHGRFLLVSFGYTACPDVCPTTLAAVAAALDLAGPAADQVQPVFVSVDPARDRPAVLADYVTAFHPRLIGLTGSETQVRAVAKAYRVHRRKVVLPDAAGPDDYVVDHGSLTYLMRPDGGFVTLFPFNTAPEAMAAAIRKYVGATAS
jgi:protein SCO1/2